MFNFEYVICCLICLSTCAYSIRYDPTWQSIDSRPLPDWYDDSKIGIFIHWGLYSVPAFGSEWFWWNWQGAKKAEYVNFMTNNYKPNFTYPEFASQFTAHFYEPDKWAEIFKNSGAKYVVLTSKHHEGYTLWPSSRSWNWNAIDIGPKRDLVGDLANAVRRKNLTFGLYHSLFEWFNPLWQHDKANNFTTNAYPTYKTTPDLYDIVNRYKPDVIWSDGDWDGPDTYWDSLNFIAWLYNDSPVKKTVVTNDRWGHNVMCHHGGFWTCMDRYNPGKLLNRKWENAFTLDRNSWGYVSRSNLTDYLSFQELLDTVVSTVSFGGNALIDVGPKADGTIPPIMEERLTQLGSWLKNHGEAIYKTKPWIMQNDSCTENVYYTQSKEHNTLIYCIFLRWPSNDTLVLGSVRGDNATKVFQITPNKSHIAIKWSMKDGKMFINPQLVPENLGGWVLRIYQPLVRKSIVLYNNHHQKAKKNKIAICN